MSKSGGYSSWYYSMKRIWHDWPRSWSRILRSWMISWWWRWISIRLPKWPGRRKLYICPRRLTSLRLYRSKGKIRYYNFNWKYKSIRNSNKGCRKLLKKKSLKGKFNLKWKRKSISENVKLTLIRPKWKHKRKSTKSKETEYNILKACTKCSTN